MSTENTKNLTLPLSNDVLTGALRQKKSAGFHFGAHIHTTIEIYRIISGICFYGYRAESDPVSAR